MKPKLAIIVSWGWTKCAWEVGVMLCLAEKYNITAPDILIAASWGSGTWSYYVAQQYDSMRNIWNNLLSVKKLVDPWRFWEIMDIDYLVDDILQKQDALHADKVYSASTHYLIPALHAETANVHYFSNKDHIDIFKVMKASMAIPIAFKMNPHIIIDGQPYCDSIITSKPRLHIAKAIELWAKKILIIDVTAKTHTGFQYKLFAFRVHLHSKLFRKNYHTLSRNLANYQTPEWVEIFTFKNRRNNVVHNVLDNSADRMRKALQYWYEDTLCNKSLIKFLSS